MLAAPAADREAWSNRARSAAWGRIDSAYLEDCRDELHPAYVLGGWERDLRTRLDQPTDLGITVSRAVEYLDKHLERFSREEDFLVFAEEAHDLRVYVENVLREGERDELGAPCPKCGSGELVKSYGQSLEEDRWECRAKGCGQWWTDHDYRAKVQATYERHATALTASAIHRIYRVPEGSVRGWATQDKIRRRGKDDTGRQLYDVADVLRQRDSSGPPDPVSA